MDSLLQQISRDESGFLLDHTDWTKEIAIEIAKEEDIPELTQRHFEIIQVVRDEFIKKGDAPTQRRLSKKYGFATKELYKLFPGGPGKTAAKIAGVKKPRGCI